MVVTIMKYLRTMFGNKWGKKNFIIRLGEHPKIMDVGCGNNSPEFVKKLCPNCYYVGIDIGDYNNSSTSINQADEYIVTEPDKFSETISEIGGYLML